MDTAIESEDPLKDDHYGIFTLGIYQPISFGKNFANKAMDQKIGWAFDFLFNIAESKVLLGFNATYFKSEVIEQLLVGNYNNSYVFSIGPEFGYHFIMQEGWRFTSVIGVGAVAYKSSNNNETFRDTGTSLWLKPTLSYHFQKHLGVYAALSYRHDFLNIDAPAGYQSFFKHANYIAISTGIRIII